jgi:proton-translocating NADH-quinone oxidoreductase chain L
MPTPALFLIIATLLPLASFLLLMFIGKRMGRPLAGWVATGAIFGSFLFSILAWISWVNGGKYHRPDGHGGTVEVAYGVAWSNENPDVRPQAINVPVRWIPTDFAKDSGAAKYLEVGVYVDSLTVIMFAMITFVATLVHVFSTGYMAEDKRFPRFFTYLGLFCFSMLGLVLGGTILQLFIFWELVGLCSYLLIGFWYEKRTASNAAIKAFVTNRVGDFGFLIGFGILFYHFGNVTLPDVWAALDATKANAQNGAITLANGVAISGTLLTVMGIGLFFGAMGKSAQFPLHVWLPDAMEGPTPVSALIHAATMVAAGVYLVGRIFPILTPDAKLFIAIIGATTLTMAALIALAQSDIKKVLAYSTLSQLGYMILAMGIGSWVGALFHLLTHAFFKALLFLGSGSVIHAAHHEQEMEQYGGLMRKIPITALTFGIAVLAIAGTPLMSAYYSKDLILAQAAAWSHQMTHDGGSKYYWLLFALPCGIAFVTAFYMTRCWMLTFFGTPRNKHLYDHAHETTVLWAPLAFLAVLSVVAGYNFGGAGLKGFLKGSINESTNYVQHTDKSFAGFNLAWPAEEPKEAQTASEHNHEHGWHTMHKYVTWAPWVGMGLGFLMYWNGYSIANALMRIAPLAWIHRWLYRRMYFDELYTGVLVFGTHGLARLCRAIDGEIVDRFVNAAAKWTRRVSHAAGLHDKYVVDGAVTGVANAAQGLGAAVRAPQTGRIRVYVLALLATLAVGVAAAIVIVVSRQARG